MLVCPVCSLQNPDAAAICIRCGTELPRRGGATVPAAPLHFAHPAATVPDVPAPAPQPAAATPAPQPAPAPPPAPATPAPQRPVPVGGTAQMHEPAPARVAPSSPPPAAPATPKMPVPKTLVGGVGPAPEPAAAAHAPHVADAPPRSSVPPVPASRIGIGIGSLVDGKYKIESVLGEGGMGVVYLAHDANTESRVVVKALHADLAASEEFRARVRSEARALARIDHPNVVRLNAVVADQGVFLLVMQYVDGASLDRFIADRVAKRQPISAIEALTIFRQVVAGVGAAHAEGVVHRDIKPANVLLRAKDGVAKVTDFGIAKGEEDAKAGRGMTRGIIGSLWYMSPEQVTGQRDIDKRVDVYALGIVLFELLMGRVPFDAPSDYEIMKLHTEAPLPSVHGARPEVPPEIDTLLARCCAKDREGRFASCDELLTAVDAILFALRPTTNVHPLGDGPAPPSQVSVRVSPSTTGAHAVTGESAPKPRSATPIIAAALVLALVAGGGTAAYFAGAFGGTDPAPTARASASAAPPKSAPAASGSAPGKSPDPLTALSGKWVSDTGRHYDAVLAAGGDLEFRIRDPEEFPGQNYAVAEPRFTLRKGAQPDVFTVEDKIRPAPPAGLTYEPVSRGTCQEDWTTVGGTPLVARYDGGRLRVDLVKVTPDRGAFQVKGSKITGCAKLSASSATKIESTLTPE